MSEHRYVGRKVRRVDGPEKVTGRAIYTTDVKLPGMLTARILRSPHPHARILNIDTSRARALSGVKEIVTGRDAWGVRHGFVETPRYPADQYVLANDKVRYVGEEVAAVAAVDEDTAIEALALIDVEYEPLPAVFDMFEALETDAPEIHPSHADVPEYSRNIAGKASHLFGDIDKALAGADLVKRDRFESQLRTHGYLEPQATVASSEPGGKLHVWTSGMGTFRKRMHLSRTLGLPSSQIRLHGVRVGGAFGGKIDLFAHEFCASLLSLRTGCPVRLVTEREEVFSAYRHGQPLVVDLETGFSKEGLILGQRVRCYNNCGAYRGSGVVMIFLCWGFIMLPYRTPALDYAGYSVYTNLPVRSPQRGHGAPQIRFAVESQLDWMAEELDLDPVEVRLKNARRPGEILPNGDPVRNTGLVPCIMQAARATEFKRKYDRAKSRASGRFKRGIGMGVSAYFTGTLIYPNNSAAIIKLNDDGTAHLLTGSLDIGQGSETILLQIAAEELGLDMEMIRVTTADTDQTPVDIGSWISGLTYITGNAVKAAAAEVRRLVLETAAGEMETTPADLEISSGQIRVKGNPGKSLPMADVVAAHIRRHRGDPIIGKGFFRGLKDAPIGPSLKSCKGAWSENYAYDTQVAEVEIDTLTGQVRVISALTAHDCGFPINPLLVEGQIDGQVSMAVGHALTEEVFYRDGVVLNPSFLSYPMPCAPDMVESRYIDVITEEFKVGRHFHTKEVGEGYVSGMVAAIANAIHNALGIRLNSFPATPQKVLAALESRSE